MLNRVYYGMEPDTIEKDKFLSLPGDICDSLYYIVEGELSVSFVINEKSLKQIRS